jgi:hypothetical protein
VWFIPGSNFCIEIGEFAWWAFGLWFRLWIQWYPLTRACVCACKCYKSCWVSISATSSVISTVYKRESHASCTPPPPSTSSPAPRCITYQYPAQDPRASPRPDNPSPPRHHTHTASSHPTAPYNSSLHSPRDSAPRCPAASPCHTPPCPDSCSHSGRRNSVRVLAHSLLSATCSGFPGSRLPRSSRTRDVVLDLGTSPRRKVVVCCPGIQSGHEGTGRRRRRL